MYAQMVDTGTASVQEMSAKSAEERSFQEKIDAGIKIEPKD